MFFNNGNCGPDPWFAYEYWSDGRFCDIEVWNGPALWEEEQKQMQAITGINSTLEVATV